MLVAFGERGVDQELDAVALEGFGAANGPVEGAGTAAEIVMHRSRGTVEGQRNHLDVGRLHPGADLVGDQRSVGGHAHAQALVGAIAGDFENVLAQQRFAAGKDHDRLGNLADVVDEFLGFFSSKIPLGGRHIGGAPTVDAVEVAALSGLPGEPFGKELFVFGRHCDSFVWKYPGLSANPANRTLKCADKTRIPAAGAELTVQATS